MPFDPSLVREHVARFWQLNADFGLERGIYHVLLNEIVSDRYALTNGLQVLRDELQFAEVDKNTHGVAACRAMLNVPSVCTTVASTHCGDRIHQGEVSSAYNRTVAARFATLSEIGELKIEDFTPAGGGTDDGATLAHVTIAHQLDEPLRTRIYEGHPQSYVLAAFDLRTHVGRLDIDDGRHLFGTTRESPYREPRSACGAIVGALNNFNPENAIHRRLRSDLGEANYAFLTREPICCDEGTDATYAVAAAIVCVQGMRNTIAALTTEMDERGVAHLTASVTVNRTGQPDTLVYCARATVFDGRIQMQGLGTDASKYCATLVAQGGELRLLLTYDGHAMGALPIEESSYPIRYWQPATATSAAADAGI